MLRKQRKFHRPTKNTLPSKTDQSFKNDCDVNFIMSRFLKTGQVTHLAKRQGVYADVSEIKDLHESMIQVTQAQEAFNMLPAHLRERFQNSPVEMLRFLQNPKNDSEAIELGLKVRKNPGPNAKPSAGSNDEGGASPKSKKQKEATPPSKKEED